MKLQFVERSKSPRVFNVTPKRPEDIDKARRLEGLLNDLWADQDARQRMMRQIFIDMLLKGEL